MEYFSPMFPPAALRYHGVGTTSSPAACCFMMRAVLCSPVWLQPGGMKR